MGEDKLVALIQESLAVATRMGAAKPADFRQVVIDTTVQEKAIAFPTDAYEFGVKVSVATPLNRCRGGQFVAHVKALPGNPYDGHTLAAVLPDIESTIGAGLERIVTDAGYKGHNAPKHQRFKVYVAGQKRGLTAAIKRAFRRRRPWSPRSVTSKTSTGWDATTWPGELAMQPTPCSLPWATTSASSSGGSLSCCASSWPSSQRRATRTGPS